MAAAERLVVGQVRGLHGLRGAVRVESLTDHEDERFVAGCRLFVEGAATPLTLVEAQPDSHGWRLRFAEIRDRTAAEILRDVYLEAEVPEDARVEGEFYWHEVIGAEVEDTDGTALGAVKDVYRAGGADVAVVAAPNGLEIDVPLVKSMVRTLDLASGRVVVDGEALGLRGESGEADLVEAAERPEAK